MKSRELLLAAIIAGLVVLIATRFPGFARPANLAAVLNDTAILIVLALGQMAVILTKCIDLSVAANLALNGMVVAMLNAALVIVGVLFLPSGLPRIVVRLIQLLGMAGAFWSAGTLTRAIYALVA